MIKELVAGVGVIRSLARIAKAQEEQTKLLARIAHQLAPEIPEASERDLRSTGPSWTRDAEQAALADFCETYQQRTGMPPSEAVIEAWLDEQSPIARPVNDFAEDVSDRRH